MNENRAVFTRFEGKYVLIHICDNRAEHIYAYDSLDKPDIGTIINCRAEDHANGIDATFVRYSKDSTAFINKKIKGQTVLPLMYKKEPWGDKHALFSDKLTIDGMYVVAVWGESFIKVSSKIDPERKQKYIDAFMPVSKENNIGFIIRTRTDTEPDGIEKAKEEISKICEVFTDIISKSAHTPAYTVLYRPFPDYVKDILYLCDSGIEELVTDDPEIKNAIENTYENVLSRAVNITDRVSLRFYDDKLLPLCNLYSFNAKISEVLSRKVYLKSGAYITFDRTEAFTAIDVNSSGNRYDDRSGDTFLKINIEAAQEIARQLRLRNLSGMMIVDFINMKERSDYDILKNSICDSLSNDPKDARFIDFTGLGLCEITRKRSGRSIHEVLKDSKG